MDNRTSQPHLITHRNISTESTLFIQFSHKSFLLLLAFIFVVFSAIFLDWIHKKGLLWCQDISSNLVPPTLATVKEADAADSKRGLLLTTAAAITRSINQLENLWNCQLEPLIVSVSIRKKESKKATGQIYIVHTPPGEWGRGCRPLTTNVVTSVVNPLSVLIV